MLAFIFRRNLKKGVTFDEFKKSWEAEKGYPVKNRVLNAVNVTNAQDVFTVGFVDMPKIFLKLAMKKGRHQDEVETDRHDRIDNLISSTQLKGPYQVVGEFQFDNGPESIRVASKKSMLRFKHIRPGTVREPTGAEKPMLVEILSYQLKPYASYSDLKRKLLEQRNITNDSRVIDLLSLSDKQSVLSITFHPGLTDLTEKEDMPVTSMRNYNSEYIDSVQWSGRFRFICEHDFFKTVTEVPIRSSESVLNFESLH